MPSLSLIVLVIYGVLLEAGGAIGYLKAKSKASLIAGGASGFLSFVAAALVWFNGPGTAVGLVLAVAMALVFSIRLSKTKKFMPSGLLLVVSLIVSGLLGWTLFTPTS